MTRETRAQSVPDRRPNPGLCRPALLGLLLGLLIIIGHWPAAALAETDPAASSATSRQILKVGPGRTLERPSQAARIAKPGALIEIDAGDYHGDVAVWRQDGLTLRGINGQARLHADGNSAQGKAIWVIRGAGVEVDNIGFFGALVPDHNGAGIRAEGRSLVIRNSLFQDNENGILTSNNQRATLLIEDSQFLDNTTDYARVGMLGHSIYVGRIHRFELRNTLVTGAQTGHQVKTRARINRIIKNRIHDNDENPASSYLIDIPEGGQALILGNHLIQGRYADNPTAIAFASEANREDAHQSLQVIANQFENRKTVGIFVYNHSKSPARLRGNRIEGLAKALVGPGRRE